MVSIKRSFLFVFCLVLVVFPISLSAETITASGSSTVHEIVHTASDAYQKLHPDVNFVIGTGGSKKGIQAVASGKVDIGQSGRQLKEKERNAYPDLVQYKIAQDGVALIVNIDNPVSSLTRREVQDIYTGKISNWKEVGGRDAPILCISKEIGRSAHDLFLKHFGLEAKETRQGYSKRIAFSRKGENSDASSFSLIVGPNSAAVGQVSTKKNAIAFLSIGYANDMVRKGGRVRLLGLDGVQANSENIRNGTYPLKRSLYVITKGDAKGSVKEFIDFLLSRQGQNIVSSLHFIEL